MIDLKNLGHAFLRKSLFAGVSLRLLKGERYGVVGANGCGKSTLLKIIAGQMDADEGAIEFTANTTLFRIGQDHDLKDDVPIIDCAMMGQSEAFFAIKRQEELLKADSSSPEVAEELAKLEEIIRLREGYRLRSKAATILEGLGIPSVRHDELLKVLSGGFKWRVSLAQALVKNPDVLMLDEPTNHLDIVSIRWLELFLADYQGLVLLVSHDKRFLNNVVTKILDVDFGTIKEYTGNYLAFEKARRLFLLQKEKEIAAREKEVAHKMAFVERFGAKATKARQAQSRLKQIERIVIEEPPKSTRVHPKFLFEQEAQSSKEVLKVKGLSKSYGEQTVLRDVTFEVRRGEKIAIIGPNGTGKSTLIKALALEFEECKKSVSWGFGVSLGYFAQDCGAKIRTFDKNVLEWLWKFCADKPQSFVQGMLGRVLFTGEDSKKSVRELSGGELGRLYLAYLMVQKPNVLLLDEPTNHLDLESIESLGQALSDYEGTLLVVSHDRTFIDGVAQRVIEVQKSGINDFLGTYSEFSASIDRDYLDVVKESALHRQTQKTADVEGRLSFEERKRLKSENARLKKYLEKVMLKVEEIEGDIAKLDALFLEEDFFQKNDRAAIAKVEQERVSLKQSLDALIKDWEETEAKLAAFVDDQL